MNVFTHLGISLKLKHIIEMNLPIKLRTFRFLLGNIKPDLSSRYVNIPHFKKASEVFIRKEIQDLMETKLLEYKKCTGNFSERLGIITHYLSDYFCYAHTEYFTGEMLEHYSYEMKLSLYFILHSKTITRLSCKNIAVSQNISAIWSRIDQLHLEYLHACKRACHGIDMEFTLNACMSLCFSVIMACLADERSFFAVREEIPA